MEQVRELLKLHYAHLMKYIDIWTSADLLPSREPVEQRISSRREGL
jgi:hypothetical protein